LKSTLKGQRFQDTKAIARSVITATLKMSFINVSDSGRITGPRVQLLKETTLKVTLSHSVVSIKEYLQ